MLPLFWRSTTGALLHRATSIVIAQKKWPKALKTVVPAEGFEPQTPARVEIPAVSICVLPAEALATVFRERRVDSADSTGHRQGRFGFADEPHFVEDPVGVRR